MNRDDLFERMKKIDFAVGLAFPNQRFECVLVGGAALLVKELIHRGTLDGDVLGPSPLLKEILEQYDFNMNVNAMSLCFPYSYLDRVQRISIETSNVIFYTISIEDLIVSKLYAYRKKDIEDLQEIKISGKYNPVLLEEVVKDAAFSAMNERQYQEMVSAYKRMFRKE